MVPGAGNDPASRGSKSRILPLDDPGIVVPMFGLEPNRVALWERAHASRHRRCKGSDLNRRAPAYEAGEGT